MRTVLFYTTWPLRAAVFLPVATLYTLFCSVLLLSPLSEVVDDLEVIANDFYLTKNGVRTR